MKILAVCQYYYPEQFRINDICEQLARDGHSVTVLTGLPNYPMGKVPEEYRFGRRRQETVNGVKVLRCFEIGRRPGALGLALNYVSYMLAASAKALFLSKNFDVVFVYQLSPVTMALPGVVMKRRSHSPLYLYCCDIWPESTKNILSDEASLVYRMVKRLSTYLYSNCDAIAVTSRPFIDYLNQEHSIPMSNITYIPQHAEDILPQMGVSSEDDVTSFLFMGNMGIAQDIDCILEAAQKIRHIPKFNIHFVGDGSYLAKSRLLVKQKSLDDIVVFHGRHPIEKMAKFYAMADACLITLKSGNWIGLTMPSKLQGYMAAGKPVIGAIGGAAKEAIDESECGVCVNAGDSDALAEAMRDFIEDPDKYKECGKNGREYFKKNYSREVFMHKLEDALERLVKS